MTAPACEIKTKKLDLPPVNTLIPKKFDVLPKDESLSKEPQCIQKDGSGLIWYMKDDKFERPKAWVAVKIYCQSDESPFESIEKRLFASVWKAVFEEYSAEFRYMAECANLESDLSIMSDNIQIDFCGFNDSMPNYIVQTFQKMVEMSSADLSEEFKQQKEKLIKNWKNSYLNPASRQINALKNAGLVNFSVEFR